MKRLYLILCFILVMFSCQKDKTPKGIIEKEKMISVLIDMHLTDSYLNQIYKPDSLQSEAHSRYNYIYKKFNIDSATFTKSLRYYSLEPAELSKMYDQVTDSLTVMEDARKPKPKKGKKLFKKKINNDIPSK